MKLSIRSRILAIGICVAILGIGAHCATEAIARKRAEQARASLRVGTECADLVAVAERYANPASVEDARRVCASPVLGPLTLNFTQGMSLNYLINVDVSPDGRVRSVSRVEAW
jgi:hypothetical protein